MSSTTTQAPTVTAEDAPSPPASAGQARTARVTAARDDDLTLWNALCDQAVPLTAMTTWERHEAGYPPRNAGERARYRELDQSAAAPPSRSRILAAVTEGPGQGAYQLAAVLGYDGRRVACTLKRMHDAGLVVALELARPRTGHPARIYFPAPEGTPPRPRKETPAEAAERRRRARISQQRRRARLAGKTITPEPLARPRVYLPLPPPAWHIPGDPACTGADPGLFFGPEIEPARARAQRVAAAQAVCAGCPVRRSCLDGALARGERWGVWGGADLEAERKRRSPKATRPAVAAAGRA